MILSYWPFLIIGLLFFYLIYKVAKNSEDMHGLHHDLNDLEVEIGVLKNEDWAIKSSRNKEKIMKEYQNYYDGETWDGKHDLDQAKYRRQEDGKDIELNKKITLAESQLNEIIEDYGGNWHEWLKNNEKK
jgi:hypothetical protein